MVIPEKSISQLKSMPREHAKGQYYLPLDEAVEPNVPERQVWNSLMIFIHI